MKLLILALGLFCSCSILAQNGNPDVIANIGDSIPLKKEVTVYGKGLP